MINIIIAAMKKPMGHHLESPGCFCMGALGFTCDMVNSMRGMRRKVDGKNDRQESDRRK